LARTPSSTFIKQFYLISANWAQDVVKNAEGVDEHTRQKARFYVEQIANARVAHQFRLPIPEVLRTTLATNGANLIEGSKQFQKDMQTGTGRCASSRPT
jgi:polyhydroxyalkanoate synthase